MFYNCNQMTTIYGNDWNTSAVTNSTDMFAFCSSLKGGNGTAYNYNNRDKTYARVDRSGTPGYFTTGQLQ